MREASSGTSPPSSLILIHSLTTFLILSFGVNAQKKEIEDTEALLQR